MYQNFLYQSNVDGTESSLHVYIGVSSPSSTSNVYDVVVCG